MSIISAVEEARELFEIDCYPGNFFNFITEKKEYIYKYSFLLFKQKLGGTSGFIGYAQDDTPIICINYERPIGHQNFTLAHEVGHFFMHRGIVLCDTSLEIDGHSNESIEQEAHRFASELLYPEKCAHADTGHIMKNQLLTDGCETELADYINTLCIRYCISFKFALYKLLFACKINLDEVKTIDKKIRKKIKVLSKRFEPHQHTVVNEHAYYQAYSYPVDVMKQYIDILVNQEEISYETGKAIYNRNMQLEV